MVLINIICGDKRKMIYLDNAATTPLSNNMKDYLYDIMDKFYNPSSIYRDGVSVRQMINDARANVASFINADSDDIVFTSGGSASNTLGIVGYCCKSDCIVLYTPCAHKSILECVKRMRNAYALNVDSDGFIDLDNLESWLTMPKTKYLIVIDYANSEIGTIQNVKKIVTLAHLYNACVYVDCTGSISQIPLNVKDLDADMAGFSGHKIHALKGVGVFYKKKNIEVEPLIYGSQEHGLFGGTENVLGVCSIGKAVECYDYQSISTRNRDYVLDTIKQHCDCFVVGAECDVHRLPHNLNLCIKGVYGEALQVLLDYKGIQISTGSACSSGSGKPSHVLKAIGLSDEEANSCIRLTFDGSETHEELDYVCDKLVECINALRGTKGNKYEEN